MPRMYSGTILPYRRLAQRTLQYLFQLLLKITGLLAGSPGHKTIRAPEQRAMRRDTGFSLPAALRVEQVAVGTNAIGNEINVLASRDRACRLAPGGAIGASQQYKAGAEEVKRGDALALVFDPCGRCTRSWASIEKSRPGFPIVWNDDLGVILVAIAEQLEKLLSGESSGEFADKFVAEYSQKSGIYRLPREKEAKFISPAA